MHYLIIIVLIFIAVVIVTENHRSTIRANKTAEVNDWFSYQLSTHPAKPLSPEDAGIVQSTMEDDFELWRELGYERNSEDCKPYYQAVIDFGRYLSTFGPAGASQTQYDSELCYGIFEDDDGDCQFRTWIEFYDRSDTVWALTEEDNHPKVVHYDDFRTGYAELVLRHPILFAYDELG